MTFNLSEWALKNRSVVIYLMIVAVAAGLFAFQRLGRNEDPSFVIKSMVVSAAWPGATIEDTLTQVTERLERQLEETPGLDTVRSFTTPGVTTIFVQLDQAVPARDVQDTWYRVRNLVADIRHTLPAGTVGPFFNDRFGDTFGIIYGFTADGFSGRELRDYVEAARSRLLLVPDVSKIEIIGAQDERIFVEFSVRELANLGIDRNTLLAALQSQNVVRPAGVIQTEDEKLSLRVSGAFQSEADLMNVNFPVGDRMVRLADIATVRRGHADPPQPMFRVNGQEAIGLGIAMRDGGDILALGQNIKNAMTEITSNLPLGIEPRLVADQAVTVDHAIADFMTSLWQSIAIIMAVSFISLGVRPGLVVALSIPLTLAVVFAVMLVSGIDMQRISLGALIIALALLVDDAMTTTDAMVTRLAAGEAKTKAATYAFKKYAMAMLAGTLVTIAGFVPIGFAASSAGEYTFTLFAVVSIALVVSWFVAIIFAPVLGVAMLKAPDSKATKAEPGRVERTFRQLLSGAIKLRWVTIAVTLVLFALSVLAMPLVPRQFFPASDRPELLVDLTLPQNASIYASEDLVSRFDAALKNNPDIERWSSYIGRGAIRFYLPLNAQLPNDFFSQAVIVAKDVAARERLQAKLEEMLANDFPNVVARVYPLELGPPVGWPVQYRVSGPDIAEVRSIAMKVAQVIAANPQAEQVNFDWIEPSRELRLRVDQDEARRLGLSSQALASALNAVVSGTVVTQVRDDIYLVDVVVRAQDADRVSLETLRTMQVALPGGRSAPLSQFLTFEYGLDAPLIWRRDRIPNLTVAADVKQGVLPETVVSALEPSIEALNKTLPPDYAITVGGTVEESAKSQASVIAVVPVMLLIMFTVLMAQLRSFRLLAIVLSIAPLGLIGVVGALLLSGKPLGFVALLGILALIGIITKNAVILIGQIEAERESGKTIVEAALDASSTRFRPIMLTAISTVLGMIPIAPTVFWGPMAFAIMGGLLVATVLTLILLPVLYVAVFNRGTSSEGGMSAGRTSTAGVSAP
ncbi:MULTISPECIES: efflux RND transporter permease subunit [unclassified Chelatococcus]|uniref:efflux RND transporter permease subunit n=1 Tax=unclassified Chelatococcus TaxID=2638111 RepID=UPI001BD0E28B|nr:MULTISPECIES: efflux RND transporter permease subunit [unclassified Chelatococcus]CAH1672072.1 Multidrug efflux pump subunit AcrB [Hyphomicrobiales bacterium]MBS7738545.1 efflux RND transporter permease subunit [Chelatococcus sp. HY11]MBX3542949.1 efflux RND transporter permease subunit [Chelatococcus sp.]MCO5076924.1 efflux RND transporter permease subunit [Chelatococcus sp.]CAH1675699.1 Multidrug efflux pump subunit AcrB [Hyphomicrobiales bacterium]